MRNVERLVFTDGQYNVGDNGNMAAYGTVELSTLEPGGRPRRLGDAGLLRPAGRQSGAIVYTWQSAAAEMDGGNDEDGEWAAIADGRRGPAYTPTEADSAAACGWSRPSSTAAAVETIVSPPTLPWATSTTRPRAPRSTTSRRMPATWSRRRRDRWRRHDDGGFSYQWHPGRRLDLHQDPRCLGAELGGHRRAGRPAAPRGGRVHRRQGHRRGGGLGSHRSGRRDAATGAPSPTSTSPWTRSGC